MSTSGPMRIVGTATLPSIGFVHGDHVSVGVGAIVMPEQVPGYDRNTGNPTGTPLPADYGPNVLFVRFREGAAEATVIERLATTSAGLGDYGGVAVTPVQRPAVIVNSDNIKNASALLGIAILLSALASITVALHVAVR